MNRATSATGWVKNPDGTLGYTFNPITGCLNHTQEGLCLGGNFPCYAYRLANGRLRSRYLANKMVAPVKPLPNGGHRSVVNIRADLTLLEAHQADPFYPRFWEDRLEEPTFTTLKPRGIFVCDMSDLFGIGVPENWTRKVLREIEWCDHHRFYLLTKQPQNLIKFSPFPENCFVGVSATNQHQFDEAVKYLKEVKATIKYISFEPLLERIKVDL